MVQRRINEGLTDDEYLFPRAKTKTFDNTKTLVAVKTRNLEIRREMKIVYRKDKHLSRAAQTFIDMAKQ